MSGGPFINLTVGVDVFCLVAGRVQWLAHEYLEDAQNYVDHGMCSPDDWAECDDLKRRSRIIRIHQGFFFETAISFYEPVGRSSEAPQDEKQDTNCFHRCRPPAL